MEHPWAVRKFRKENNDGENLMLIRKNMEKELKNEIFLENKTGKLTSNYPDVDDFVELKPKRFLKSLENEKNKREKEETEEQIDPKKQSKLNKNKI